MVATKNCNEDPMSSTSTRTCALLGGEPPKDRPTPVEMFLNPVLIYICDVFTGISILVAVVLLIFNIVTIQKP